MELGTTPIITSGMAFQVSMNKHFEMVLKIDSGHSYLLEPTSSMLTSISNPTANCTKLRKSSSQ